jgi:hypothetical protein
MSFNISSRRVTATAIAVLGLIALTAPAKASTITSLNQNGFASENGGNGMLNYSGFQNFTVSSGSVDLIPVSGNFDFYPHHGLYVDMCGSTNQCGSLTSKGEFAAGTYNVVLHMGGPTLGFNPDGVSVKFDGTAAQSTGLITAGTTHTFVERFVLASAGFLTISDLGLSGNSNVGSTLLGVNVYAAPLPGSLVLFGTAIAGLMGFAHFRRKLGSSQTA